MGTGLLDRADRGVAVLAIEREMREDRAVRAVLVAEGRMFSPGGDLRWMAAQPKAHDAVARLAGSLHAGLRQLLAIDAPIVARVEGAAAGAGLSLVTAADLAFAGASASFTVEYAGVGLSPGGGASWLLPRPRGQSLGPTRVTRRARRPTRRRGELDRGGRSVSDRPGGYRGVPRQALPGVLRTAPSQSPSAAGGPAAHDRDATLTV